MKPEKTTIPPTQARRPLGPNGELPPIRWTTKGDPRTQPLPPAASGWKLERRPLSFFKGWHGRDDNHTAAIEHVIASGEKPIPFPEVDETGHGRDGHHRVAALKKFLGSDDAVVPMWVLHLKPEFKRTDDKPLLPPLDKLPTQLARENSFSWLDPRGTFHPVADSTHAHSALRQHRRPADTLLEAGWHRVTMTPQTGTLWANGDAPPNPHQMKALKDHAIEEGHKEIVYDPALGSGEKTLWTVRDDNPEQMAATQAPAGGMVVNNQYQSGGRFLPRALLSIRQAVARRMARRGVPAKLARNSTEKDLNPGVSAVTKIVSPVDLNPTLPRRTMTDDEVRRIEDAHGLTDKERLKRKVDPKTGTVSTTVKDYAAFADALTKKQLGKKLHTILNDPATPDTVKAAHLFHHVRGEAEPVLSQVPDEESKRWYGETVGKWEAAMHHLLSRDVPGDPTSAHRLDHPGWGTFNPKTGKVEGTKPFMRLAKGPLAYTSGDAVPSDNTWSAYRMIRKAAETDPHNPFMHLPELNHDELRDWVKAARQHLPPGTDLTRLTTASPDMIKEKHPKVYTDAWDWHLKHGKALKEQHKLVPGYSEINIVLDRNTGKPVAISPFRADDEYKPWPGVTAEQVVALAKAKQLRPSTIPNPGLDGHLRAKGWGKQSGAIVASSRRLGKLVSDMGPVKAAEWLESEHPVSEVKKYHPNFSWGALPKSDSIPGSYIFGEKYGPFFQNLAGKDTHFTLDKWMARHAYRAMGTLLDAKTGNVADVGRNEADKRIIGDAFRKAADHFGVSVSDLQALVWDMEQSLYNLFGVQNDRDNFHVGGQRVLQRLGFDPRVIEATGGTPSASVPLPTRRGPQQVARRGTGKPGAPTAAPGARPARKKGSGPAV